MKLALFGGTFDPIHRGHTALAECAWREARLDRVLFVPARRSPLKSGQPCAGAPQRCAMIELAIQDFPWAGLWKGELERPAPSYSWQTAAFFRNTLPGAELFWILGADQWNTLPHWSRPDFLSRALTFLVFRRGEEARDFPGFRRLDLPLVHPASSTAVRQGDATHLDPRVARYIRDHGLYAPSGNPPDSAGAGSPATPDRSAPATP